MRTVGRFRRLIAGEDFAVLGREVGRCGLERLADAWREFRPIEKLILFKLMEPKRAFAFYARLDFDGKYFLLCAFDRNTIAPVLDKASRPVRALFKTLPASYYDRMLRLLASEQVEIQLTVRDN
ncbi:MAG: hypothetical protein ABIJ96_08645 [Elusimicrobiota bacterium]